MRKIFITCFLILCSFIVFSIDIEAKTENNEETTVLFKENVPEKEKEKILNGMNLKVEYEIPEINLVTVEANNSKVNELKNNRNVDSVNESTTIDKPRSITIPRSSTKMTTAEQENSNLDLWQYQWDMKAVTGNKKSYNIYTPSTKTVIGVIDSGIYKDHPDLANSIVKGSKNLVPRGGYNGTEPSEKGNISDVDDKLGHGTGVAGQIAANGLMKGAAPGIGIKSYRVFGTKSAKTPWVLKAIVEAAKDDVDVINLSLGEYMLVNGKYSDGKNDSAEYQAYKRVIDYAYKRGSIVVAAVGNDGIDVNNKNQIKDILNSKNEDSKVVYGKVLDMPGDLNKVVTVGSTGPTQEISIFSNYGKNFIDVLAPGGDFRLLQKYGEDKWTNDSLFEKELLVTTSMVGGYYFDAGVSYAAPKVSATLGLIVDKKRWKNEPYKTINHLKKYSTYRKDITKKDSNLDIVNAISH